MVLSVDQSSFLFFLPKIREKKPFFYFRYKKYLFGLSPKLDR